MPPELVVPVFALVLAANAILIFLALRAFTGERDPDRPPTPDTRPAEAAPNPPAEPDEPQEPPLRVGSPMGAAATGSRSAAARGSARARRRRFALPALEEDHERFNRSISTLLSGGKSADGD